MDTYNILLEDGTVGTYTAADEPLKGYVVTVCLSDENGNPIYITGIVEQVL